MDHQALLAKVQAPPRLRRPLKAWLQAGILEDAHLSPTTAGTPQGGSCSPLLALSALHGMEEAIPQVSPHARVIPYAEDGVVLHEDCQGLEHCQELLKTWLIPGGIAFERRQK
jgi:RNA-directed DNA polymerase